MASHTHPPSQDAGGLAAEEPFLRVFEDSGVGMCLTTFDGELLAVNNALCHLLGYSRPELMTLGLGGIDDGDAAMPLLAAGDIAHYQREKRYLHSDGHTVRCLLSASAVRDEAGVPVMLCAQLQDVTEHRAAEARADRRTRQQAAVAQLGQRALERTTPDEICRAAVPLLRHGLAPAETSVAAMTPDRHSVRLVAASRTRDIDALIPVAPGSGHAAHALSSGEPVVVEDVATEERFDTTLMSRNGFASGICCPVDGGDDEAWGVVSALAERPRSFDPDDLSFVQAIAHLIGAAVRRHAAETELLHQSRHDHLTGLPNRTVLNDRLEHALEVAKRTGSHVAVLFLDLDRFKDVNDSRGHGAGDRVLAELVPRLVGRLRTSDTLVRFGGDEFAVVCEGLKDPTEVHALAERLLAAVAQPVVDGELEYQLTASVGIAVGAPEDAVTADDLIRDADTAMYRAKAAGGNRSTLFDDVLRQRVLDRVDLEGALRSALRHGELFLLYQPLLPLDGRARLGSEALLRWRRPGFGIVPAAEFIEVAEESELIVEIDEWVIERACAQVGAWLAAGIGLPELRCGMNISARHLSRPELVQKVAAALERHRVPPGHMVVEITETALTFDPGRAARTLAGLRSIGVWTGLDDFGTGFSSLTAVRDFPLASIKLDRSFVAELTHSDANRTIVRSMCAMGAGLDLTVVAEGVETDEQAELLRDYGCHLAQGYLFAHPLAPDDFARFAGNWLRRQSARPAVSH